MPPTIELHEASQQMHKTMHRQTSFDCTENDICQFVRNKTNMVKYLESKALEVIYENLQRKRNFIEIENLTIFCLM